MAILRQSRRGEGQTAGVNWRMRISSEHLQLPDASALLNQCACMPPPKHAQQQPLAAAHQLGSHSIFRAWSEVNTVLPSTCALGTQPRGGC